MNRKLSSTVMAAGILLLTGAAACTSTKNIPATISDLTGEWDIVKIDGTTINVPADQESPYIAFDTKNGQISGNASCNMIMGSFDPESAPGTIDLSKTGTTRMMCPDMKLEDMILGALSKVDSYRMAADGNIELCHKDTVLLLLQKREPSVSAAELKGAWNISEINGLNLKKDTDNDYKITFDPTDKSFSCQTGCNNVSGSYDSEITDISFHSIARTEMACPDMTVEDSVCAVLPRISSFGILAGGSAGFYDSQQNLILLLER